MQSAGKAAAEAVEQKPQPSAAADRVAGLGAQAPQEADQARSAAEEAFNSVKQAADTAGQGTPPPPPAAQDAASSAAQSLKEQAASSLQQSDSYAPSQAASRLRENAGTASDALQQSGPAAADAGPPSGPDALSQLTGETIVMLEPCQPLLPTR